ncbi:unnamed protein product [Merluccius merluccius]
MKSLARSYVWWPRMDLDLENKNCLMDECSADIRTTYACAMIQAQRSLAPQSFPWRHCGQGQHASGLSASSGERIKPANMGSIPGILSRPQLDAACILASALQSLGRWE